MKQCEQANMPHFTKLHFA